jgi:hypothetical protein
VTCQEHRRFKPALALFVRGVQRRARDFAVLTASAYVLVITGNGTGVGG